MNSWRMFVAAEWPSRISAVAVGVVWLAYLSTHTPAWRELTSLSTWLVFMSFAVATFAVAACVAMIGGSMLLAPIYRFQASQNGAPFEPGDQVRILSGTSKGRVAFVYSTWQGNSVRVELGESTKEQLADIYGPHQLELVHRKEAVATDT